MLFILSLLVLLVVLVYAVQVCRVLVVPALLLLGHFDTQIGGHRPNEWVWLLIAAGTTFVAAFITQKCQARKGSTSGSGP